MLKENIDLNNQNVLNILMECQYCGYFFSKSNKPLILNCFHNICEICHEINSKKITCLLCHSKFEGKSNKRHPINFILLEVIEKTSVKENEEKKEKKFQVHKSKFKKTKSSKQFHSGQANPNEGENELVEFFHCTQCDLNFPNKFHLDNFTDHILTKQNKKTISEERQLCFEKSGELMKRYKNFNVKLEKNNSDFFEFLNERIKFNVSNVLNDLRLNSLMDNLSLSGFINGADKKRLNEFLFKYCFDEARLKVIENSKTFDELFLNLKKEKEFNLNNFISSFFYFEEILEKKLKINLDEKNCEQLKDNIKLLIDKLNPNSTKDEEIQSLLKYFIQDLSVEVIDCLDLDKDLNNKFKLPVILTNANELIVFNPLTEKIKNFGLTSNHFPICDKENPQEKKFFSFSLDNNYNLYISGGISTDKRSLNDYNTSIIFSEFFSTNLLTNTITFYKNLPEPRYNHSSIIIKKKIYIIGGKNENNLPVNSCFNYSIIDKTWNVMQNCPYEFNQRPVLLNFENDFIYLFEDLKHFLFYDIKSNKWTVCNPVFKDAFNLNIINFCAIYSKGNILILGGSVTDPKGYYPNENIYHIKDIGSLVTKKGEFRMDANFSCIDSGYLMDYNYLLICDTQIKVHKSKDLESLKWDELKEK